MKTEPTPVIQHAALLGFRRSRTRCSCICGWQSDWRNETAEARAEWAQHVAREQQYSRNLEESTAR